MIIIKIMGGLGNQMFQYAMARRLADKLGVELKMDLSDYRSGSGYQPKGFESFPRKFRLADFRITAAEATPDEIEKLNDRYKTSSAHHRLIRLVRRLNPKFAWPSTHIRERQFRFDSAMLHLPSPAYLQGFWQSPFYFADAEASIRQEFQLRDRYILERAEKTVADLRDRGVPVVSLHIRRGDLAHAHEVLKRPEKTHGSPVTLEYIDRAMQEFPKDYYFLVFSDTPQDVAWCRENIRSKRIAFTEASSDIEDFAAMSACDHHIISNSTFSWWAAWLNPNPDKRVITPRTWSSPQALTQMPTDDLLPDAWTRL